MQVSRGYKVELDLNNKQVAACRRHAGAARWAYNWGLSRKQAAYASGQKSPSAIDLHRELNALKKTELPWLYEVSKTAPQEALRDLDRAFANFFRKCALKKVGKWTGKCGYPRRKSRKRAIGGARFTGSIHVYADAIQLPRLGRLRLKEHRYLPTGAPISSATITERAGRWYVSIALQTGLPETVPASGQAIGVDLGVKSMAALSDGRCFDNPMALRRNLTKLRRASRSHSRKVTGSRNRAKAKSRLARVHARLANIRKDALHKATSAIVARTKPSAERPSTIVLEDLAVANMLRNRKLSRAISDVGFHEFRRQLEYKAASAGIRVLMACRWEPSSKTCSACGWYHAELSLAERVFLCTRCGLSIDRDYNAALNLRLLAVRQEVTPVETVQDLGDQAVVVEAGTEQHLSALLINA